MIGIGGTLGAAKSVTRAASAMEQEQIPSKRMTTTATTRREEREVKEAKM